MFLGRIIGQVVATKKNPYLEGCRLLVVQGMKPNGECEEDYKIAVDGVDAGNGEWVLTVSGSSAKELTGTKDTTTDTSIHAIVDRISLEGKTSYSSDKDILKGI